MNDGKVLGADIEVTERMAKAGDDNFSHDERFDFLEVSLARVYRAMEYTRRIDDAKRILVEDGWAFNEDDTSAVKATTPIERA